MKQALNSKDYIFFRKKNTFQIKWNIFHSKQWETENNLIFQTPDFVILEKAFGLTKLSPNLWHAEDGIIAIDISEHVCVCMQIYTLCELGKV